LIDPIKCPRVLKFLNSRLPKTQFEGKKKGVGFVTKKEIDIEEDIAKPSKINRKILSEKLIKFDFNETMSSKIKTDGKKKTTIRLPPIEHHE